VGIVHFGLGAFTRAHQAWYTDRAMALDGGDWMIAGISLRSPPWANS
jgi:fructuronate reductase